MKIIDEGLLKLSETFKAQTTREYRHALYNAVLDTPKGAVVEIGSACGGTTLIFIDAAKRVNKMVYSVDPYPEEFENKAIAYTSGLMKTYKESFVKNILNGNYDNIIQFNQDLNDCIDNIPNEVSVVFIDGCHELSFVQKDYELLLPKMVKGGVMFFHDLAWNRGQVTLSGDGGLANFPRWINERKVGEIITDFEGTLKIII